MARSSSSSSSVGKVAKAFEGLHLRAKKKTGSKVPRKQFAIGGSHPIKINPKDKGAVIDAKTAVERFNESNNRNLRFVSIVGGRQRLCAGYSYDMVITATDGDDDDDDAPPKKYHVNCWSMFGFDTDGRKGFSITSFQEIED